MTPGYPPIDTFASQLLTAAAPLRQGATLSESQAQSRESHEVTEVIVAGY